MRDPAGDPAALELLLVQRNRLADRMRPPWWYLAGIAVLSALVFAVPFTSRLQGISRWPIFAAALAITIGTIATERFLVDRDLLAAAIVVAALAVVAEVAAQEVALRGIRQEVRAGGGVA